jgi:squalene synthase HpnC
MPVEHYENFPVASILLPKRLRPAVEAIYAFARTADDLADEGDATASERLTALAAYDAALDRIAAGATDHAPPFERLAVTVREHELPLAPLYALLSAFKQDVVVHRYATYDTLLDYCARSANPVGQLMLHLYGAATEENLRDSDAICSALQLIIYLPLEDLARYAISPAALDHPDARARWRAMMKFEVARARALMHSGAPLALRLKGRIGFELRLVVQGGLRILDAIEAVEYDVFRHRPKLEKRDWLAVFWAAVRMKKNLRLALQPA